MLSNMNACCFNAVIAVECFENAVNFENFVSALDRYAVLSLREKALCGMSLKRHLVFIPICDVTINNSDLVVSNLTEKYIKA